GAAGAGGSLCAAKKFASAARYFQDRAKCEAGAVKNDEPVDAVCVRRAAVRFGALWSRAEAGLDCITADDQLLVRDALDGFVEALGDRLRGVTATTSTTIVSATTTTLPGGAESYS